MSGSGALAARAPPEDPGTGTHLVRPIRKARGSRRRSLAAARSAVTQTLAERERDLDRCPRFRLKHLGIRWWAQMRYPGRAAAGPDRTLGEPDHLLHPCPARGVEAVHSGEWATSAGPGHREFLGQVAGTGLGHEPVASVVLGKRPRVGSGHSSVSTRGSAVTRLGSRPPVASSVVGQHRPAHSSAAADRVHRRVPGILVGIVSPWPSVRCGPRP